MKAEKKQVGILSRAMEALTRNWGLKILSLVLAIIVYHSLKPKGADNRDSNDGHIFQYR